MAPTSSLLAWLVALCPRCVPLTVASEVDSRAQVGTAGFLHRASLTSSAVSDDSSRLVQDATFAATLHAKAWEASPRRLTYPLPEPMYVCEFAKEARAIDLTCSADDFRKQGWCMTWEGYKFSMPLHYPWISMQACCEDTQCTGLSMTSYEPDPQGGTEAMEVQMTRRKDFRTRPLNASECIMGDPSYPATYTYRVQSRTPAKWSRASLAAVGYALSRSTNCYNGHGGHDIPGLQQQLSLEACARKCNDTRGCTCFVHLRLNNMCFLRSKCVPWGGEDEDHMGRCELPWTYDNAVEVYHPDRARFHTYTKLGTGPKWFDERFGHTR
eukprot:TRINITY_DN14524_c1_g1_i1.p1 TRINITY_DN14524_c1_g1~~TRINITY_DN14524_c1_g1_i1.p1  ORF type:complete len:340 (-),score=29.91 TRINITY_DN14524_c1_g1_i1:158-1135(-)